ncbi:hypothetical protein [Alteriqipengyuania sp.]|uniref:hypothetical protein n=1 Tax=Alteriqipengyuania sp. TaxID=2800692 RepID=UPI0035144D4C
MYSHITLSAVLLAIQALGGVSPDTRTGDGAVQLTPAQFAALDPTRAGRAACRGLDRTGSLLDARLALASRVAANNGTGAIGLTADLPATDLPLDGMEPEAKRYFEQGIAFTYGFNHAAAIRSFGRAAEIDPDCALCWWGIALANGPNINSGMSDAQNRAALEALEKSKDLSRTADPDVRMLILAQGARYSADPEADRASLNRGYAKSMLVLAQQNPDSDDLAALAAEAAMTTTPWNYWDEAGEPRPLIAEAVALLEKVMARNPAHPQAPHLYIHLLELPDPTRAEAAADMLREHAPKGLAHLVHMPAHIYYRLGRYGDSIDANAEAVVAEEAYLREVGDDGLVRYGYYPHNVHFLLASAQMMGDVHTIVTQTAKLERILDTDTGRQLYWVQAIYAAPYFAYAQYSSPEAILALTDEEHPLAYVDAMRHYARAVAFAQTHDPEAVDAEIAAMEALMASNGVTEMVANGFPSDTILQVAIEVARGRAAMASGRAEDAIAHFAKAAELQDAIPYSEPPFWYYPVEQSLGAAYYQAGRYAEAKQAFRAALFEAPNSALALYGLERTERKLGNRLEAQAARMAFDKVWRGEDAWLAMGRL